MKPTQIELTAKRFKMMRIAGSIGVIIGIVMLALSIACGGSIHGITPAGSLVIIASSVGISYAGKILAWWFHG